MGKDALNQAFLRSEVIRDVPRTIFAEYTTEDMDTSPPNHV